MAQVDPQLLARWRELGDSQVDLIVHVEGDLEARGGELARRGATVRRRYRLTGSLSIRCPAGTALELARLPWVTRIEPDRQVRALGR